MIDDDTFDPEGIVPMNACCICLSEEVHQVAFIESEHFPFCKACEHRSTLLQRGRHYHWPALRIEGLTGTYAMSGDAGAYVLTALQGTDARVVELLDALEEYEQRR